ncbi:MAG: hypothetical protein AAF655_27790 [Bacteroidota bacterium]
MARILIFFVGLTFFFSSAFAQKENVEIYDPFAPSSSQEEPAAPATGNSRSVPGPTDSYIPGDYSPSNTFSQASEQPSGFQSFVCVWEEAEIKSSPQTTSPVVGKVFFGDIVTPVTQSVSRGGKRYIEVEFQNGRSRGFIDEYYFEAESGPIALLKGANVYASPDIRSSFTGEAFRAGDIAVVTDFDGEWIQLLAAERTKKGWIRGFQNISISSEDIKIAAMLKHAREKDKTYGQKRQRLELIRAMPGFIESPFAELVRGELLALERGGIYYPPPKEPDPIIKEIEPFVNDFDKSESSLFLDEGSFSRSVPSDSRVVETKYDQNRQPYRQVTETGSFQPVDGPKSPSTRYWCYHKDKPKGSAILLQRPDGSYLKLEVVNKLRQSNQSVIGLGAQVLREVFGNSFSEVKTVRITYIE